MGSEEASGHHWSISPIRFDPPSVIGCGTPMADYLAGKLAQEVLIF